MLPIRALRTRHLRTFSSWEADSLLQLSCNKDKAFILTHPEYRLGFFELMKFYFALFQFKRGVPLAYISHHKEFYGLDFYVDRRVLTPRPETELMVEEVVKVLSTKYPVPSLLIDVGTGSGCVPIAIMKTIKHENIKAIATDISMPALQVAKRNAKAHGVRINFLHGNLLEPVINHSDFRLSTFDFVLITANLPYGWKAWKNNGSIETKRLNFEPQIALFTGENGLELYRKLLEQIKSLLLTVNCSLLIYLEFDPRQTELLSKMITEILPKATFEIKTDLAGRDRLAIISL